MDLIDYIYDECHRQHVTNYGDFARAWSFARGLSQMHDPENFGLFVEFIAMYVQPSDNEMWNIQKGNLRTSHVGFLHGGSAAPVNEVRPRFDRWCQVTFDQIQWMSEIGSVDVGTVDVLINQLLDIHPWVDANGRTASILRNWMLNRLDDPEPLPYYDF